MVDLQRRDLTPDGHSQESNAAQWVVIIGFVLCGIVITGLVYWSNCKYAPPCLIYIPFAGPYVLLGVFASLVWNTNVGRVLFGIAASLELLLGILLFTVDKGPPGSSPFLGLATLSICAFQYMICVGAIVAIIIVWSVHAWRHKHEQQRVNQMPLFDSKLVTEMEKAMASKETADLRTILSQAQDHPDQYAEELVKAVQRLLVSRGETPSS